MKILQVLSISLIILVSSCHHPHATVKAIPVIGQLKVGFDIDDTVLFSRDNFLKAPHMSDDPDNIDFGWVNEHDSSHSVVIQPVAELIGFLRSHGHEVYFITARPGINGEAVGEYLSEELGFEIIKDENLFFSPKKKDPLTGKRFTSKHEVISELGLHVFFGDADNDMVAASIAGVRAVRVVRDHRSVEAYSRNYFGDLQNGQSKDAPFSDESYLRFLSKGVGPFGETIYPIYTEEYLPLLKSE